jgi:hypothetical protein
MKLNNKGWGLGTMLICVAVILIFLIIAAFYTIRFNKIMGDNTGFEDTSTVEDNIITPYYVEQITKMTNAADNYINDNNIKLTMDTKERIYLSILVNNGYLEAIKDYKTDNSCDGYVVAYLDADNIKNISAYLKCDNYVSNGYGE